MLSQENHTSATRVFKNNKRYPQPGRQRPPHRRSYSESSGLHVPKSRNFNSSQNDSQNNRVSNKKLWSNSKSPVIHSAKEKAEKSPAHASSKFSKINDTITKSKKFSNLYVKSDTVQNSKNGKEKETLDDTFTIDPSVNPLPEAVIPHVEESESGKDVNEFHNRRLSTAVIDKTKCARKLSCSDQSLTCNFSENNRLTGSRESDHCHSLNVEPAENYSYCVEDQTGSNVNCEQNDSGASTLVDQSANSVGSLASISTLVDGGKQNLSQNLSGVEEKSEIEVKENISHVAINSNTCVKEKPTVKRLSSETVTKSKPDILDVRLNNSTDKGASKVVRSIKFDNMEKSTPHKGLYYLQSMQNCTM